MDSKLPIYTMALSHVLHTKRNRWGIVGRLRIAGSRDSSAG